MKKKKTKIKKEIHEPEVTFSIKLSKAAKICIVCTLILLAAALPVYYLVYAYSENKENGFPLDDPWIHLQFAKNIIDYGKYSYYKDEIVTAGSTSPVYTFLAAIGFLLINDEMILSYIIGISFFALAVFFLYKLSENSFPKENWLAIGTALIFLCDRWMNFIADSGMETTLFIFLLTACFYFYRKRNAIAFALLFGLVVWVRPDGIAFIAVLIADYLWLLYVKRGYAQINKNVNLFKNSDYIKIGIIFTVFILLYFGMNLQLSGTLLPNTYTAKLTYYTPEYRSRSDFLRLEVWQYFTDSGYALLIVPFFIALILIISDSVKRKYNIFLLPALFIPVLILIYWYKLPYAARFGRYLMPIIPFYILIFGYGSREFFKYIARFFNNVKIINWLNLIFVLITIAYFFTDYNTNKKKYAEQTRYIAIRQVASAKWLRDNTSPGSIVAVHDVGALAFYSNRKIVDVAGLINPELSGKLLDKNYASIMTEEMKRQKVSYIAFLREWYRVVNQSPLFTAGENNYEVMEVHKFDPEKTHILRSDANSLNMYALDFISQRQYVQAANILKQSAAADPNSSLTYFYLGLVSNILGDRKTAESSLKKSLDLFPSYKDATFLIADIYKREGKLTDSERYMKAYLQLNPNDTSALSYLSGIRDSLNLMNSSYPK